MARLPLVVAGVVLAGGSLAWTTAPPSDATPASDPVSGVVRVNQQGYLPGETKQARLMTTRPVQGARFRVVDARGRTRLRGTVPARPVGRWNARYPAVYRLGFDRLRATGRYRIVVAGAVRTASPWFRVLRPGGLFGTWLRDGVLFDQVQRDGQQVVPGRAAPQALSPARPPCLRLRVAADGAGRRPDPRRRPRPGRAVPSTSRAAGSTRATT